MKNNYRGGSTSREPLASYIGRVISVGDEKVVAVISEGELEKEVKVEFDIKKIRAQKQISKDDRLVVDVVRGNEFGKIEEKPYIVYH